MNKLVDEQRGFVSQTWAKDTQNHKHGDEMLIQWSSYIHTVDSDTTTSVGSTPGKSGISSSVGCLDVVSLNHISVMAANSSLSALKTACNSSILLFTEQALGE